MTDDKPWYGSRTILLNAIGGIAALAAIFGLELPPEAQAQLATLIMLATNLANIALRFITTKPIRKKAKGDTLRCSFLSVGTLMAIVLLLGACDQIRPTSVDAGDSAQQTVFAATADYGALVTIAEGYESLPRCGPEAETFDNCSRTTVVSLIRAIDNDAFSILSKAQEVVRGGEANESTLSLWARRAQGAVSAFQKVLENHGLMGGN